MKYTKLLPFLENEELKKIAFEIVNGDLEGVNLTHLFPFLDREDLHEVVNVLIDKKDTDMLNKVIPFVSKEMVLKIYYAAEKGELPDFDTSHCIPFLGSDKVKDIFRDLVKKSSSETDNDH
jgi:hypothetical protein